MNEATYNAFIMFGGYLFVIVGSTVIYAKKKESITKKGIMTLLAYSLALIVLWTIVIFSTKHFGIHPYRPLGISPIGIG
jgi:tryptophan-rich sensory protein